MKHRILPLLILSSTFILVHSAANADMLTSVKKENQNQYVMTPEEYAGGTWLTQGALGQQNATNFIKDQNQQAGTAGLVLDPTFCYDLPKEMDNHEVPPTNPVPEPATLFLAGSGLIALTLHKKRAVK